MVQDMGRAGQQHAGEAASTSEPSAGRRGGARDTGMRLAAASPEAVEERWSEYEAGKRRALEKIGTEKLKRRWFGAPSPPLPPSPPAPEGAAPAACRAALRTSSVKGRNALRP